MDVVRQLQPTRHLAVGIVVAVKQVDRYSRVPKPAHLTNEEQPSVEVLPISVVDVASNHHELDLFIDGLGDQVLESVPGRGPQALSRRIGIRRQTSQGTVEMEVGGVDELHIICPCINADTAV